MRWTAMRQNGVQWRNNIVVHDGPQREQPRQGEKREGRTKRLILFALCSRLASLWLIMHYQLAHIFSLRLSFSSVSWKGTPNVRNFLRVAVALLFAACVVFRNALMLRISATKANCYGHFISKLISEYMNRFRCLYLYVVVTPVWTYRGNVTWLGLATQRRGRPRTDVQSWTCEMRTRKCEAEDSKLKNTIRGGPIMAGSGISLIRFGIIRFSS